MVRVQDRLVSIENLKGGSKDDTLKGNEQANILEGNDGDDTLIGRQGDDRVFGGAGNDRMIWNSGDGVSIEHTANTDICLALDNNTVATPGSDGFNLLSNRAGQFQVIDFVNVTSRNIGTFNPADIDNNDGFVDGTPGVAPCL